MRRILSALPVVAWVFFFGAAAALSQTIVQAPGAKLPFESSAGSASEPSSEASLEPGSASPLATTSPRRPQFPAPMTFQEKWTLAVHRNFGPPAFALPAAEAGITMIDPPDQLPGEWHDGPAGFARLYGSFLARHTTGGLTRFAAGAMHHEDPRYIPCVSANPGRRALHAVLFTLFDQSDSGRRTVALGNFAGAAAGGFIGMAYQPTGFNDVTHSGQRTTVDFSVLMGRNILAEFSPELRGLAYRLHLNRNAQAMVDMPIPAPREDHPMWWTR